MIRFRDTHYLVTDNGEVFSEHTRKFRKLNTLSSGYVQLDLYREGECLGWFKVHRMVAECYHPNPNNHKQVNHKDGDKGNNKASNLEWCTASENCTHRNSKLFPETRRLSNQDVITIRNSNLSSYRLSSIYGISHQSILKVINKVTYKDV